MRYLVANAVGRGFASAFSALIAVSVLASPTFQGLGDFPQGEFYSYASGVSGDGSTVVGYGLIENRFVAFKWDDDDGMVSIDQGGFPGQNSYAVAASFDGSVIVGQSISSFDYEAFRWQHSTGMVFLGDLAGGIFNSYALGVNYDGSVVVGGSSSELGQEAFRWTLGSGMVGLGSLSLTDFYSEARGVSGDGSIVVGQSYSNLGFEAFCWTPTIGIEGIGDLPGGVFDSAGQAISANGNVIVGQGSVGTRARAFRWTMADGMRVLPATPFAQGFSSIANSLSADGEIIVGRGSLSVGNQFACIWIMPDRAYNLKDFLVGQGCTGLTGWQLIEATGCSYDGRTIVGWGINPEGFTEAWVAEIDDPTLRRVSGCVDFQDLDPLAVPPSTVVMEFRVPGTTNVIQSSNVLLDPNGEFQVSCPSPPGVYDIALKYRNWLRRTIQVDVSGDDVEDVVFDLINGDCDWNNEVNLFDYSYISISFGKSFGEPGYRVEADLDLDREITLVDYAILSSNFGALGDD